MNLKEQLKYLMEDLATAGHSIEKKFTVKDADPKQLEVGILVEYEHTDLKEEATKIAIDHLSSVSDYYTKLIKSGLVDEKDALDKFYELYPDEKEEK
jgi:orotate phosphoribosyltransferase